MFLGGGAFFKRGAFPFADEVLHSHCVYCTCFANAERVKDLTGSSKNAVRPHPLA